jgi:hypothetical protein
MVGVAPPQLLIPHGEDRPLIDHASAFERDTLDVVPVLRLRQPSLTLAF